MKTLEQDVRDKLDELRLASGGRLQYKVFHMDVANITEGVKKDPKEETLEEQLSKKGLEPFQVESIQADEVGVRLIYSGMTLSYKEKPEEILPRIYSGNLYELEYGIVSKLYRMMLPEVPKIALVAPYEERSLDPNLMALMQQLGGGQIPPSYREDPYELLQLGLEYEGYPVARVTLDQEGSIPKGTKTLAIIEPKNLNDRQKYEINRFLCEGGSVFMGVQNYEFSYKPTGGALELVPKRNDPGVNDLLAAWGFAIDPGILADEQSEMINLSGGGRTALLGFSIPIKLPVQILLSDKEMNLKISITSRLPAFFYLWGSALTIDSEKMKGQNLRVETLLHSTKNSWTVPFNEGTIGPESLAPQAQSPKGPFPLAILAEGQFADAFRDKKMPEWPSEKPEAPQEAGAPEKIEAPQVPEPLKLAPGKLILIGAATPFRKQMMQSGGHLNFFLNSVDVLTLGDELIGVRSKGPVDRTLPKVSAPVKMAARFFVTLLVPILIAVFGFSRAYLRRRAKKQYLKTLA